TPRANRGANCKVWFGLAVVVVQTTPLPLTLTLGRGVYMLSEEGSGCSKFLGSAVLASVVAILGLIWAVYTFYKNNQDTQQALDNQSIQIAQQQTQIALVLQQNHLQSQQLTLVAQQISLQSGLTPVPRSNAFPPLTATAVSEQATQIALTSQAITEAQKSIEATQTAIALQPTIVPSYHPRDAVYFQGHYYRVYTSHSISWSSAKTQCESQAGHLVVITSTEENNFVWGLASRNEFPTWTVAWIGATDSAHEGKWEWVTGEAFRSLGNLIAEGGRSENYLNLRLATGRWEDFPLYGEQVGEQWYICEWE
ncbi:hypothetical protein D6817_04370, partial [Candidatus Pacearchaeota archaeon]